MKKLQDIFPQIQRSFNQTVKQIINRDYNQINRWTKSCAIYNVGIRKWQNYNMDLIANLFNPDLLIREITAWAIYEIDPQIYKSNVRRLIPEQRLWLDGVVRENATDIRQFTIIRFLQEVHLFRGNPGVQMAGLIDRIEIHPLESGEIIQLNEEGQKYFYLVYQGEISYRNDKEVKQFRKGDFVGEILQPKDPKILALSATTLLKIEKDKFYDFLINNNEIALSTLRNLNGKMKVSENHLMLYPKNFYF